LIKIQICDKRCGAPNFEFLYYFPETSPLDLRVTPQWLPTPKVRKPCFTRNNVQLASAPVVVKGVAKRDVEFAERARMRKYGGNVESGVAERHRQVAVDWVLLTTI